MRFALILAGVIFLNGCNVVVTKAPLLTRADEAGAPALRPGVWRMAGDSPCAVDEARALADWPECAGGVALADGQATYLDRKAAPPTWARQPFILAGGDPRIAQAPIKVGGDVTAAGGLYAYAGAVATRLDVQGRIVGLEFWPVQCGPPPPQADEGGVTKHPLPGIEIAPGEIVCSTASVVALRAAAKASKAWTEKPLTARWVRDGAA